MTPTPPTPFLNPTIFPAMRYADLGTVLNIIVPLLTFIAALIFFAMIIYCAFIILTASGDAEKYAEARNRLTFAVIGLLTILFAYLITKIIGIVFNVQIPI